MYIKSIIIDGFKSYSKRIELKDFDPEFTAITGLNGSGKSNILDSICFVLGISNLRQVRATSFQDLIHKGNQSNITKATVTLVFDNTDPDKCPLGYEKCREISVTRQIALGGKNKYMINGKNVLNKKVVDLFCSCQMNVNNPNFLIMQGRITKVLSMKPNEILSMIEEAAGTSIYEIKREASCKLIEKKDVKIRETNTLLKEEVEPKLEKLRKDYSLYIEYQKICRDIEYLTRIDVSHKYLKQKELFEKGENFLKNMLMYIENSKKTIMDKEHEIKEIEEKFDAIQKEISSDNELQRLEEECSKIQKIDAANNAKIKILRDSIDQENREIDTLKNLCKNDETALVKKQKKMEEFKEMFTSLKEKADNDYKEYIEAQKKFEAITQGVSDDNDGDKATLQDQLIKIKARLTESETLLKKFEMELKHNRNLIKQRENEIKLNDSMFLKDQKLYSNIEAEIQNITSEMKALNYEEGILDNLQKRRSQLTQDVRNIKYQLERKGAHQFELKYSDPEPNFDRSKFYGMLGKLVRVKSERDFAALSACAGGNLYCYVAADDVTSKKILHKGEIQQRITIFPLNKISPYTIQSSIVNFAQNLVGKENVFTAMSLIDYEPHLKPVMEYVFGHTLICKDLNVAKKVTYHQNIKCRTATLGGDILDPDGTLSGGSTSKGGTILKDLNELSNLETALQSKEYEIFKIDEKIELSKDLEKTHKLLKEKLDLARVEINACSQRLENLNFNKNEKESEDIEMKIDALAKKVSQTKDLINSDREKIRDIELKLLDSKGCREKELKLIQNVMKAAKMQYEKSTENWKKREQDYEAFGLDIKEAQQNIEKMKKKIINLESSIEKLNENINEYSEGTKETTEQLKKIKMEIKLKKDKEVLQNKDLKSLLVKKENLQKQIIDLNLNIKKKEVEITKIENDNSENLDRLKNLEIKYPWIKEDCEYFGAKNTRYDYTKEDPIAAGNKLKKMCQEKYNMEKNINLKAVMLLDREEEQYKETLRRKKIIAEDKEKIKNIICKMDEKKKEKLEAAWRSINKNFGDIFSTLLTGAQAKLNPVYQNNNLLGLEIKVAFRNVWKESLNELSGGQRSLVALSLVLAMLKFSPAPLYILDEVDSALDMEHTENIGVMFKKYFKNAQFIVVSLKLGLFGQANVIFLTSFENNTSIVRRNENYNHDYKKKADKEKQDKKLNEDTRKYIEQI